MQPQLELIIRVAIGDDLARAVGTAPPGATLVLAPGVHRLRGALVVERPIALVGPATLTAGLAASPESGVVLDAAGSVVLRDLDLVGVGLLVRGQTVLDAVDLRVDGAGVAFTDRAAGSLRRALIENGRGAGVHVSGRAKPSIEAGIFLNNAGPGIAWADDARGEAHGNLLEGNAVGLEVSGRARPHLLLNTFRRNAVSGPVFT